MTYLISRRSAVRAASIVGAMIMGLTFSSSAMAGEKNDAQRTCASMGAPHGSPGFSDCMLQQQQRRDDKMLKFLAEQRMHQELGRPAREKLEEKRARRDRDKYCR